MIVPAVKVMGKADDLPLSRVGPGDAQAHHGRFGARRDETHAFSRRYEVANKATPVHFGGMARTEMRAAVKGLGDRLLDRRIPVPRMSDPWPPKKSTNSLPSTSHFRLPRARSM